MRYGHYVAATLLAASGLVLGEHPLTGQSDSACTTSGACAEVAKFTAAVTDFRESASGTYKLVAATVRFRNKTDSTLTLGFVTGSGLVVDDRGNRFSVNGAGGVRGIGAISGNTFDPKFTLQPGEEADARFEFAWQPGRDDIYGTSYEIDLAIREIDPIAADQYRLGREHALHFTGFGAVETAASPTAPAAASDPCEGQPRCHYANAFAAEVTRVNRSVQAPYNDQIMEITVKFTNLTPEPLILGYSSGSSVMVDDVGNRYLWGRAGTHDTSARGIGLVTGRAADPSFALKPGDSGNATFKVWFRAGRKQVGTSYTFDFTVEQLEILPSQQIRSVREYAIGFRDLTVGTFGGNSTLESVVRGLIRRR